MAKKLKLPRPDFPKFLTKNFDPLRHKDRNGLIHLVKTEIEFFWEGQDGAAVSNEHEHKVAVEYLAKLKAGK